MKKLFLIILLLIPINVFAANNFAVDNSDVTIKVGEKKTIKVTANNSAGKLDISSSDSMIVSVSQKSIFLDNNTESIEVVGNSAGKATVSIIATANYATYDETILEGEKVDIVVNVISKGNDDGFNPGTLNNRLLIIIFILLITSSVTVALILRNKKETN